jgi:hypothetical protein
MAELRSRGMLEIPTRIQLVVQRTRVFDQVDHGLVSLLHLWLASFSHSPSELPSTTMALTGSSTKRSLSRQFH